MGLYGNSKEHELTASAKENLPDSKAAWAAMSNIYRVRVCGNDIHKYLFDILNEINMFSMHMQHAQIFHLWTLMQAVLYIYVNKAEEN